MHQVVPLKGLKGTSFLLIDVFYALQLYPRSMWICGGDWNCIVDKIDVEGGKGFAQKRCPSLVDLLKSARLIDSFRLLHANKQEYTFYRPGSAPSLLDRFHF